MASSGPQCNQFSTLSDVIHQSTEGDFNITQIVQDCPGLCALAWGTGNPDLSGIGANISYIIQAVLTVVFGPILSGVYRLIPKSLRPGMEDLHIAFLNASALFTIPVAIATIFRLKQTTLLFEVTFLYYLTTMQFLSLLGTSVSALVFDEALGLRRLVSERAKGSVFCCVLDFWLYMACLELIQRDRPSWANFSQLIPVCQRYQEIVPQVPPGLEFDFKVYPAKWTMKNPKAAFLKVLPVLIMVLALSTTLFLLSKLAKLEAEKKKKIRSVIQHPALVGFISLGFSVGVLYTLVQLQLRRNDMRNIAGPEFEDDEWGFGQILAIFLWAPLLVQAVDQAISSSFAMCIRFARVVMTVRALAAP